MIKKRIKKIQKKIDKIIGFLISPFFRLFAKSLYCIVNIEGGIASQLEQYTMGQLIKESGNNVFYDTSAYVNGKSLDVLGENARNFDLNKLDKNIRIEQLSERTIKFYRKFFRYSEEFEKCKALNSHSEIISPIYLGGYGYGFYSEREFELVYQKCIKIDYDDELFGIENKRMLGKIIQSEKSVGMHVRRGDTLLPYVGRPIPKKEYYLKALSYFDDETDIYIFSDDMKWVEEELFPYIDENQRCTKVELNGADKGWCDLILMANCKNQIKSPSGGMGREAYRLNANKDKILVMPVLVPGNNCEMLGNIIEIILDDTLCDMSNVNSYRIRL